MALTREEIKWATILALTTPPKGTPVRASVAEPPQEAAPEAPEEERGAETPCCAP